MSRLKILNNNDITDFDSPPVFSGEDRKRIFYLPKWVSEFDFSEEVLKDSIEFRLPEILELQVQ
ncbi:MAG: hypothetical protein GY710_08860 [Desulfobacteraceae bacterium]|nr:hypothetical protein [Desulfobacteraceae bacterium]